MNLLYMRYRWRRVCSGLLLCVTGTTEGAKAEKEQGKKDKVPSMAQVISLKHFI
jgi:hypothetical protein